VNHKRKRPKSQRGMGRAMGQKLWKQNGEKRSAESRTMQERRADLRGDDACPR
jgi:hypothetical protein